MNARTSNFDGYSKFRKENIEQIRRVAKWMDIIEKQKPEQIPHLHRDASFFQIHNLNYTFIYMTNKCFSLFSLEICD